VVPVRGGTVVRVIAEGYRIRPLAEHDAGRLAAAYDRNREHLAPWDPVRTEGFYTAAVQQELLDRQLSLVAGGQLAAWVLEHPASDSIVGRININNVVRGVLAGGSLGYWVDQRHLRRGLATALVEHACEGALEMGLHRVDASTRVENEPSQQVLLRAGFELIGTAPKFLFIAGAWRDHHLYQRILHDRPL
jgi:ribosomal-protein-alanine N-acetyltransferase